MGNLICISGPRKGERKEVDLNRSISPIPSLRHLKPKPAKKETLQDICVAVIADHIQAVDARILPPELIQRVVDVLCDSGKVNQALLQSLCLPWLHQLQLADYRTCSDDWLAAASACSRLLRLDLSNCNLVTDAGLVHVSKFPQLRALLLVNCCQVSDQGLHHLAGLVHLCELSLEGCEGLTGGGLSALRNLAQLRRLNLAQCSGLKSSALWHLSGLSNLEELSLGYCWQLGKSSASDYRAWLQDNAQNPNAALHLQGLRWDPNMAPCLGVAAAGAAAAGGVGDAGMVAGGIEGGVVGHPGPGHLRHHHQQNHHQQQQQQQQLVPAVPGAVAAAAVGGAAAAGAAMGSSAGVWLTTSPTSGNSTTTSGSSSSSSLPGAQSGVSPPWGVLSPLVHLRCMSSLSLAGTRVTDQQLLAVALWLPTTLQQLDLSGTGITAGRGLQALSMMAGRLEHLKLRCVKVGNSAGPRVLAGLTGLRSLDLSCTGMEDRGLLLLQPLTKLTSLSLDMCDVTDAGCQVLRYMPQLQHLDLSEVRLTDTGAAVLKQLRELRSLVLSNTSVGDAAVTHLAGLTALTQLHLDARGITDHALLVLQPLAGQLRELDLHGAGITSKGAAALRPFTLLTRLDLCGAFLSDGAAGDLCHLTSLQHLNLAQNSRLGDAGVRLLAKTLGPSLEALNLSYTCTSDAALPLLPGMKALRVVVLTGCRVTPGGAAWLTRVASPGLLVKCSNI